MTLFWLVVLAGVLGLINGSKQDVDERIIHGSNARSQDYPMYVKLSAILPARNENTERLWCSGAILAKRYVLTTAGCVGAERKSYLENAIFHVYAGNIRVSKNKRLLAEQRIRVKSVISYPTFDADKMWGLENDIALIVLERPLVWTDTVKPVKLAYENFPAVFNEECYIAGHGIKGFEREMDFTVTKRRYSNRLRAANVDVAPNFICNYFLKKSIYWWNRLEPSHVCTATLKGANPCGGDAASPIMCKDPKGEFHLVGLASYGMSGYYCVMGLSANTNVEYFKDWIADNMS